VAVAEKAVDISGAMVTGPVPWGDWVVIAPVAICVFFGAVLLMLRKQTQFHAAIAIGALALVALSDATLLYRVMNHGPVVMTMGRWLPPFGITFAADALGAVFALAAAAVALVGAIFAIGDVNTTGRRYGFYPFLLLMMAGVSGAFLTGDIFNLYVWFEVLLISSFGLLILGSEKEQIDGATKYSFLNLIATTLFLTAVGYLYGTLGTLNMADIAEKAPKLRDTGPLMTIAVMFFFAFGMKAAAFPVNFWLPASYHTPRIVTSALFAGLLTKVGIYALLRVLILLLGAERAVFAEVVAWVAAATMLLGALGAIAQTDLRRLLGFLVISGIGTMLAGFALASHESITGTVFYAIHSMIVMTALYMLAGMIGRKTGSFSLHDVSGLYVSHPWLAVFGIVLSFAISGLPPLSGLWPKILLVKSSFDVGAWWLGGAILLTGLLTTITMGRVFALMFWRNLKPLPASAHQAADGGAFTGYIALSCLTVPVIAFGVYPEPFLHVFSEAAKAVFDIVSYSGAVFPAGGGS